MSSQPCQYFLAPNSINYSSSGEETLRIDKSWPSTTVFVTQVIIVYIVILCALINLTFYPQAKQELWITLLSSSIGYLLPSATIKKPTIKPGKKPNVD